MRLTESIAVLVTCLMVSPLLGQHSSKRLDEAALVLDSQDHQSISITLSVMCLHAWQTDEERKKVFELLTKALRSEWGSEVQLFNLSRANPQIAGKMLDLIGDQLGKRNRGRNLLDAIKAINELGIADSSIESKLHHIAITPSDKVIRCHSIAALISINPSNEYAKSSLARNLSSGDVNEVRSAAYALCIANQQPKTTYEQMHSLLEHSDTVVKTFAAVWLLRFGETDEQQTLAKSALRKLLQTPDVLADVEYIFPSQPRLTHRSHILAAIRQHSLADEFKQNIIDLLQDPQSSADLKFDALLVLKGCSEMAPRLKQKLLGLNYNNIEETSKFVLQDSSNQR